MKHTSRLAINTIYNASSAIMLLSGYQIFSGRESETTLIVGVLFFVAAAQLDDDVRRKFRGRTSDPDRRTVNPN